MPGTLARPSGAQASSGDRRHVYPPPARARIRRQPPERAGAVRASRAGERCSFALHRSRASPPRSSSRQISRQQCKGHLIMSAAQATSSSRAPATCLPMTPAAAQRT
ncbi:hypothetical protein K523DRAFT_358748 [Schizophyllum commune Tattone D]|nr:hypothetical protein K523DRAFT_358748 [Schizophyllum commune Tattone D]